MSEPIYHESLSIEQLPYTQDGSLEGKFLVQLRDEFTSHHAGVPWDGGRSMEPVFGRVLRRLVATTNNVIGVLRVEGEPFELGVVEKLRELAPDAPRAVQAVDDVARPQPSPAVIDPAPMPESAAVDEPSPSVALPAPPEAPSQSTSKPKGKDRK
jgi:hypothetical protein